MAAEIERFAGPDEADGYLRLRDWLTRLYRREFDGFIGANFDSPLSLLTPQLARLAALGGFRRWDSVMRRFLNDERLLRVFTFQALYAGVPPHSALAVYAVIAYMDTVAGVYFPRGGMRAVPDAMAAAAADAGVEFRYGATVSALERSGARVTAVHTDNGERIAADAVVLTTELPDTYRLLGRTPRRLLPLRPAPSAVVAHVGLPRGRPTDIGHHTILFGDAWEQTFRDIIDDGPRDGRPVAAGDPADRRRPQPGAARPRSALRPGARAEHRCRHRWTGTPPGPAYVDQHARRGHATGCPQLGDDVELLHVVTPPTGRARAWSREPRSRWRTPSPRPARSGPPTRCAASTTWCWPVVDRARGRRAHRDDVRAAGRRPDHRRPVDAAAPTREVHT